MKVGVLTLTPREVKLPNDVSYMLLITHGTEWPIYIVC